MFDAMLNIGLWWGARVRGIDEKVSILITALIFILVDQSVKYP
jgi:hypothetical protein